MSNTNYSKSLMWIYLIVVWVANINDLIRGEWFYPTTQSVIFWNCFGILALVGILMDAHQRRKKQ